LRSTVRLPGQQPPVADPAELAPHVQMPPHR
jgi:hypothetical protein